ncbi:hypothetical protein BURKHO8Y_70064 [Burkholderia sp. 8Y]|nr:hypothetical protein BURKHO8Y_70064 [Burkholderia sp. 8Y]
MAGNIVAIRSHRWSGRGHVPSDVSPGELMQSIGWIPVALSAALIVSGLVGRKKGAVALALTACAGGRVERGARCPAPHVRFDPSGGGLSEGLVQLLAPRR